MNRLTFRVITALVLAAALLPGCGSIRPAADQSHLLTFTTQLRSAN